MAATNINLASTISSIPTAIAVVASISIAVSYSQPAIGLSDVGSSILVDTEVITTTPLPDETINVSESSVLNIGKNPSDSPIVSEAIDRFDVEIVKTDSVTAVESRVKVFTDFIDFDPSDDDVDPTPVTISEAAAFDLSKNFSGADDVTPSESITKEPTKPGITASVSTSEDINNFNIGKNPSDTATASEAVDRFDVTTVLDDTVTITESTAKNFTQPNTDSVSAVQSNVKAFTSNIDFDLSDADVDPDPVTASDAINEFDFNKGLSDTSTITEATAKNFTHGGLSDTVSPTESTAFDVIVPGLTDSFTAVEGIKNNPTLGKSDSVAPSDSINSFSVTSGLSDTLSTPTDVIDSFTVNLAKSDTVTMTEVVSRNYTLIEDFDRTDADADPDPVTVTESIAFDQNTVFSDVLSLTESITQFAITTAYSDTASVTESINTSLVLGESTYLYPDFAVAIDGAETGQVRGYHIHGNQVSRYAELGHQLNEEFGMLNEAVLFGEGKDAVQFYDKLFIQDRYRFRKVDTSQVITHDGSVINTSILAGASNDGIARRSFTGVLGAAEQLNEAILNTDTISYPDAINAGLLLNFIYTDTDDTELGGHYLNETPLCAGARF